MPNQTVLKTILDTGVVAILRVQTQQNLQPTVEALFAGGVCAIEITLTSPGALSTLQALAHHSPTGCAIGVGSVLDAESARAAILAGAQFVVTPTLNLPAIELCKRYSVPVMPGAYTPTEIITAWQAGADIVKLFPCDIGGPAYLKAVKAPLPQVLLAAVGGVSVENASAYIRAGAVALGVGSSLVNEALIQQADWDAMQQRARNLVAAVQAARGSSV
ncbi:MAG: bifunctional 4-hydroxy-2-oxoglutarate aldolase/2-dehydro-3-deoxy-phosphogluconate aldolase [Anaerolineae bacterium]|nr:bifunctional 4-hydroxy-2-oxoglutarate aldolase/2-dehydro-3-deoxy-phosphogluconate aldolase [Anaerolineae bacterium]